MIGPKEATAIHNQLLREGQISFTIIFMKAKEDQSSNTPVANVTIISTNPTTYEEKQQRRQMSLIKNEWAGTIQVIDVFKSFKALWRKLRRKGKPERHKIIIKVEPIPPWDQGYSSQEFSLQAVPGTSSTLVHVWLKPA